MKTLSLACSALFALASVPLFAATPSADPGAKMPGDGQGYVVIFCHQGAMAPAGAKVKEDGLSVATISNDEYVIVATTPGRHSFAVYKTESAQQVVDVAPGSVAYLEVSGILGLNRGPDLKVAALDEAKQVLPLLRNYSQPSAPSWSPTTGGIFDSYSRR